VFQKSIKIDRWKLEEHPHLAGIKALLSQQPHQFLPGPEMGLVVDSIGEEAL
jgi:hypothetical protein